METQDEEEKQLRSVALQNARTIQLARLRAERELLETREALRESSEHLTNILESITDGFAVLDAEWRITYLNPQAATILAPLSSGAKELIGKIVWEEFPDLLGTPVEENCRRAAREQVKVEFEFFYPSLEAWFAIRVYPGKVGLSVYFEDIGQRKRAEEALRLNEEFLRATFDQAAVGIAVADLDGRFRDMNDKFCSILGYSREELCGMSFLDLTHPEDRSETEKLVKLLLAGEVKDYVTEKRYLCKNNALVWSMTTVTLLKDTAGRPQRFIGVIEDITQRKLAEDALHRSEQFNRSIIESSRDCSCTLSLDGALLWMSETGKHVLNLNDATPPPGTSWIDLWQGEDRAAAAAAVDTAAHGCSGNFVGCFPVNGQRRWWDVLVTPILDAGGKPEKLLAIARDVTARRQAEERVRRSEEELRALADSIPQLAWMAEPDGYIFWYNRGWYDYTGTTPQDMRGWGWQSVHDPGILPQVMERWQHSLHSGEPFEMEFPLRGADGTFRWFLTRVHPVRDSDGRVLRWFGTNTDVNQVKQIREALEDETRILELLNQTGTLLSSNLDQQTLVQSVTDAATQLSGARFGAFFYNVASEDGEAYTLYTLSGAPREAFEGIGLPRKTPLFSPTYCGEGVVRSDDITRDPRYGKTAPHHGIPRGHLAVRSYLAVPVSLRSGKVIGGLLFGHPEPGVFTERHERIIVAMAAQAAIALDNARLYEVAQSAAAERKQLLENERAARAEAERTSELKDAFLANLSHELRTPLGAILGWAQVLRLRTIEDNDVQQGIETIERNARIQTQLIEDLLDMSRITSGKVRLDVQALEPYTIIESAIETVAPAADAKGIRLERLLDPRAGPISGDPHRLQQVAWNLLSNAIKFTPRGGKVQILLERVNSHIEISIADTGIGIEPEFLPHVFERFRQADASTTRKHGGLGLGLSIVKNLVELHGGSIHVTSAGKDCGTTFVVHLPLSVVRHRAEDGERLHPGGFSLTATKFPHADLGGLKVLVVDDEQDARELIRRVLADCGAEVITAARAEEALVAIENERPHLLLSDIGMPEMDGYELLKRVQALGQQRGGKIPAIALTAFARSEDRTRALRAGFLIHISKPVEPSELVATVASVTGRTGATVAD